MGDSDGQGDTFVMNASSDVSQAEYNKEILKRLSRNEANIAENTARSEEVAAENRALRERVRQLETKNITYFDKEYEVKSDEAYFYIDRDKFYEEQKTNNQGNEVALKALDDWYTTAKTMRAARITLHVGGAILGGGFLAGGAYAAAAKGLFGLGIAAATGGGILFVVAVGGTLLAIPEVRYKLGKMVVKVTEFFQWIESGLKASLELPLRKMILNAAENFEEFQQLANNANSKSD